MSVRGTSDRLSEEEIDDLVVAQVDDDSSWDEPVRAKPSNWRTVRVPAELMARAAALATRHHESSIDAWIRRVIQERIEIEEAKPRR